MNDIKKLVGQLHDDSVESTYYAIMHPAVYAYARFCEIGVSNYHLGKTENMDPMWYRTIVRAFGWTLAKYVPIPWMFFGGYGKEDQ